MPAVIRTLAPCFAVLVAAGCQGLPRPSARLADERPAGKIEVAPSSAFARPKTDQVLVATVYGPDGQPWRKQRVEWALDGPGTIVAADESGAFPASGARADSKSAVTFTNYFSHDIDRGTGDRRDDFSIKPGQTWIVVSSAVEGQTTVTATAPGVGDRDAGRAYVALTWGDGEFRFPPPAAARAGGETSLNTTVAKPTDAAGRPIPYQVRYRIVGGTPAAFVADAARSNAQEAEVPADAEGTAAIRVIQPTPQAGKTRVAVEVVKADPAGVGPGSVVGRSETTIEWTAPDVSLDVALPAAVPLNGDTPATITLANTGRVDSSAAVVRAAVPEGTDFVSADPAPTRRSGRDLVWEFGPVRAGDGRTVTLVLRPTRRGPFTLPVAAETEGGLRADKKTTATADAAALAVTADAAPAAAGGTAVVRVGVTNTGAVPLANAVAWVTAGPGLRPAGGADPAEVPVGAVEPGRTRTVEVPLTAETSGRTPVRVNVTADGGVAGRADTTVAVVRSELKVAVTGPDEIPVGGEGLFEVRVTNAGDAAVRDVEVRTTLPAGATRKANGTRPGAEGDRIGSLNPNETKVLHLTLTGGAPAERGELTVTAAADDGPSATGTARVAVVGRPVLVMDVTEPSGPMPVGGRATYRVTVRNRGTGPARRVAVSAEFTGGLVPAGGTGPDRTMASIEGGRIIFPAVAELPAGAAAVFLIDAAGSSPGPARVSVRTTATELTTPLQEDQATRVLPRR